MQAAEVVETLQLWVVDHPLGPGDWLQGQGWDQTKWNNNDTYPTKEDLDGAFPTNPVYLSRYDGHAIWVNSATLAAVPPLPPTDPDGGVIVRSVFFRFFFFQFVQFLFFCTPLVESKCYILCPLSPHK